MAIGLDVKLLFRGASGELLCFQCQPFHLKEKVDDGRPYVATIFRGLLPSLLHREYANTMLWRRRREAQDVFVYAGRLHSEPREG